MSWPGLVNQLTQEAPCSLVFYPGVTWGEPAQLWLNKKLCKKKKKKKKSSSKEHGFHHSIPSSTYPLYIEILLICSEVKCEKMPRVLTWKNLCSVVRFARNTSISFSRSFKHLGKPGQP